ncbi:secretory lipase-domain-containing protein [Absidia repens]|uniref:Secretory lipase-domain-containing protein n=1 Tax=Absidia repens TaxID=90262 RepID=A0A1X2I540_9FUNG|nr:secretory lipase-domain-containing protein [Absidia repens]
MAPGQVLKKRNLGPRSLSAFTHFPQHLKTVYQFLYRTTDGLGQPVAAVATLAIPYHANYSTLVSHQTAEDSISKDCAPSFTLRQGAKAADRLVQAEIILIDSLLKHGWPVLISDYESVNAMFGVGLMAGHGVLDGIRAVLASGIDTGMQPNAKVQLYGYSGGALASGWAVQLHKSYAPELDIIGAVMGGTPVDIGPLVYRLKGSGFEVLGVVGLMGLMKQYPELAEVVNSVVRPDKRDEFETLKTACVTKSLIKYGSRDLDYYLNQTDFLDEPISKMTIEKNLMGRMGPPAMPLFMFHAENDEVIPYKAVEKMYTDWCKDDARIEFVRDNRAKHAVLQFAGAANGILFLERIYNGIHVPAGCSMRATNSSAMDPGAPMVFGKGIWNVFSAILGIPIGPIL